MKIKSLITISLLAISGMTQAYPVPFKRNVTLEKKIVANYADLAYTNYLDSLFTAKYLELSLKSFTNLSRTRIGELALKKELKKAKMAWEKSRLPYGQSEIFRFYNGPIDFQPINDGVDTYLERINFEGVEGLLNAWPLDEAYIDYVEGAPEAGLINDPTVVINREQIELMNERDGEKNISTGYHAIEFLLWGQDRSLTGPGDRPVSDYTVALNADRRRQYLNVLGETLVNHLKSVTEQWVPGVENYRREFLSLDSHVVLGNMFTSMIAMAGDELKSERIENALLLEDQEEEQSCFSDTTVHDIFANYLGVKNVYMGDYKAHSLGVKDIVGPGINDLVAISNPLLDQDIQAAMREVEQAIAPFYGVSVDELRLGNQDITLAFDVAILKNQDKVQRIVDALHELEGLLIKAASELGLQY